MTPPLSEPKPNISPGKMGGGGLRIFSAIAKEWNLTPREQLGILGLPETTFRRWKQQALAGNDVTVDSATLERLSYILGIYKALGILLPQSHASWIRHPNSNPLFGGKPALDRMMAGQVADLYVVRQYLDAWRGGWA